MLFWSRGYHDVSTRELTEAMGINVNSLYSEFGSKRGLFDAAMAYYNEYLISYYLKALETADASVDAIRQVVYGYAAYAATPDEPGRGCLIVNSAVEWAPDPEASAVNTARFIERLGGGFRRALANSCDASDDELEPLANHLVTTVLGIIVLIRAQTPHPVVQQVAETAIAQLETRLGALEQADK